VTSDALMSLGFEVEEAGSAAEAVRKFQDIKSIGGAIVDLGLPDRKGDVLVGELRAMRADLPVIIASGYGGDTLKARFAGQKLIGFLTKPYQIESLETALRDIGIVAPGQACPKRPGRRRPSIRAPGPSAAPAHGYASPPAPQARSP
jgi:DNA-binding NtrC family response regulator